MNNEKNCENKNGKNALNNVKVVNSNSGKAQNNKTSAKKQGSGANNGTASQNKTKAAMQDNRYQSGMGVGFEQDR